MDGGKEVTRKRLYDKIKTRLQDYDLPDDAVAKEVVDEAVDCALEYVLSFAQEVSSELVQNKLYSEAMVSGVIIRKLKALLGNE